MVKDREREQSTNVVRTKSAEYVNAKIVEDILDNFDFEKCNFVMTAMNWQWHGARIPTVDQLMCSARQRLESAIKGAIDKKDILPLNSCYYSSSGGLKATAWRNRYGHLESAKLEFVITEWDSDGDYIRNENKITKCNSI